MPDAFFDWSSWVYGLIAALIALAGFFGFRKRKDAPRPTTSSKISVKGSGGATVAGRDIGTGGERGAVTESEIEVEASKDARVAGRDDRG